MEASFLPNQDAIRHTLWKQYHTVRAQTESLARPLAIEDYGLQGMADASPPKWHLAHTTWFFETFVLRPNGYDPVHPAYAQLFNSYYETVGQFWPRDQRGLLSRPTVEEVYQYRALVDQRMEHLMRTLNSERFDALRAVIVLGLHHEQQHQELLLTDILYNLSINPLRPEYRDLPEPPSDAGQKAHWRAWEGGLATMGYSGEDFCFDNEKPIHTEWLEPFLLQDRLVTNREYRAFVEDGGYATPTLWLSSGWYRVQQEGWRAPLYWYAGAGEWQHYTLGGMRPLDEDAPVCHVSYFEADAYARWAGKRLPREGEWEVATAEVSSEGGNFVDSGWLTPVALSPTSVDSGPQQMFGDVWEWTQSAYQPYPGYRPVEGALGEYNGKFMVGQQVLRGGSCATPRNHVRATYRNFFPPDARWQFSGIRLAEDGHA